MASIPKSLSLHDTASSPRNPRTMARARRGRQNAAASPPSLALQLQVASLVIVFVFAFSSAITPTRADHVEGHMSHEMFGYENDATGPAKWGSLHKEWAVCGDGKKQSPIDITTVEPQKLKWKDGNSKLTVQGKEYTLKQVHWHEPSEHTINGTRFDAEMHMVHEDPSMARAVVSVLLSTKAGQPNAVLTEMAPHFKNLAGKEKAEEVKEPVDPSTWVDKTSGYYRYDGSLTTPPCTEGVIWTIMSKIGDASKEQIDLLKTVATTVEPNARPAQKLNDRIVRYFEV
uniref:Carbonic anhydrase n=1 Tax=Oryza nivara TaxID=4536 RepID=A0A0E0GNA4_ORYNI